MVRTRIKLQTKILLFFILTSGLSLVVVNILWFNSSRDQALRSASSRILATADDFANQVNAFLEVRLLGLIIHSQTESILSSNIAKATTELQDFLLQDKDLQELSLIDKSGQELIRITRSRVFLPDELVDQSSSPAFKVPTYVGGERYISNTYVDEAGEPGIYISVPVIKPESSQELQSLQTSSFGKPLPSDKVLGVLKANYRLSSLWRRVETTRIGKNGYIFLVDDKGNTLVHPNRDISRSKRNLRDVAEVNKFLLDKENLLSADLSGGAVGSQSLNEFGVPSLTSHASVHQTNWGVIIQIPLSDTLSEVNGIAIFAAVLFILTLGLLVLAAFLISRQIVKPLEELQKGSRLIGDGNFDYRLQIKTGDEIEDLAFEFNTMADTLKKNINQLTAQNSLLLSLRSLDSLSVSLENVKAIAEAVVSISHKELGFFLSTLALVDKEVKGIRRISISSQGNPKVQEAIDLLPMKFEEQVVPLTEKENLLVKSVEEKKTFYSDSLYDVQRGCLSREISRKVQEVTGIRGVFVYPLITKSGAIGTLIYYTNTGRDKISENEYTMMQGFATEASQILEGALLYEALQDDREVISAERNKLALVLSGVKDAVIAVDTKRKIIIFNSAAEKLIGLKAQNILGKEIGSVLDFYEADKKIESVVYCPIRKDKFEGLVFSGNDLKGVSQSGEIFFVNLTVGKISEGKTVDLGCILTLHDVTGEKQLEEMKLDFVSMAAHELRTPLTSIRGYLALFMDENTGRFNKEQETYLNRIDISSQQLSSLVDNLLNVSRIEKGELTINLEPVDWPFVIKQTVESFLGQARERKISLEFVEPAEVLPKMKIDKIRMGEVLNNLISNAISYSRPHGHVKVWMEIKTEEVITHIEDDGPGVPPSALPHLFTKFFRVAGKLEQGSKGTGLGLYISKAIVELHKGRIWADSNFGKGSVFSFALPAQAGRPLLKNDS